MPSIHQHEENRHDQSRNGNEVAAKQPEWHRYSRPGITAAPLPAAVRLSGDGRRTRRDEVAAADQPRRAVAAVRRRRDLHAGGVVTAVVPRASLPDQDAAHPAVRDRLETIWVAVVVLPLWVSEQLDQATADVFYTCLVVLIVIAVIPWRYVFRQYVVKQGDPWRRDAARPVSKP